MFIIGVPVLMLALPICVHHKPLSIAIENLAALAFVPCPTNPWFAVLVT